MNQLAHTSGNKGAIGTGFAIKYVRTKPFHQFQTSDARSILIIWKFLPASFGILNSISNLNLEIIY